MENITAVQEAIENLNQDEKINEGTYLSLMNHLKVLYGKLERQIAPPPQPVGAYNGQLPANYPYPTYRQVIHINLPDNTQELNIEATMLHSQYFPMSDRLMDYYGVVNATELVDFLRILDVYLSNDDENLRTTLADGVEQRRNRVEALCRHLFCYEKKFPQGLFKDATMRDKWLLIPYVRKYNIRLAEDRKYEIRKAMCILGQGKEGDTEENWCRMFFTIGFPFFNHLKCQWTKGKYKVIERDATEIKKLHRVNVSLKLTEEDALDLDLYTDKIQLGRSPINRDVYTLALILSLFYGVDNVLIERYIRGKASEMMYYEYPKLRTSGITAKTRDKARTYEVGDEIDWSITYKSKLNDVEEGTE